MPLLEQIEVVDAEVSKPAHGPNLGHIMMADIGFLFLAGRGGFQQSFGPPAQVLGIAQ